MCNFPDGFKDGERVLVRWSDFLNDEVQARPATVECVDKYEELRGDDEVTVRLDSPFHGDELGLHWYARVHELERL